jgi:hypothetical protein
MITKKNNEDIKAKVLEVTTSEIKFKKFENLDGPTFSLSKADVIMIRYENGTKDLFSDFQTGSDDMAAKGVQDAKLNYKGQNSGATWTAVTAVVTSPVLALIPAIVCSSAEPKDENLNCKNLELMKNMNYNQAYTQQAHKIKRNKIWKNYGIGSGIWLVLIVLLGA